MKPTRSEFMLVWPLTIMALTAVALLAATLMVGARQVDLTVRQHEEFLVRRGIDGQVKAIETALATQTVWDDAVVHLDNRFDPQWAQDHIANYLSHSIGVWDYLVVDADDQPLWADRDVTPMPPGEWAAFRKRALPVIAEIRELERRRGPVVFVQQSPGAKVPISKPIVIAEIELIGGRPYMWIASLVQPDFGAAAPDKPKSAIVIGGGFITTANLADLQNRYDLAGVHMGPPPRRHDNEAFISFPTTRGGSGIAMIWRPQRPGHDLLINSMWVAAAVLFSFAALAGLMLRATRRAARTLINLHRAQAEFLANMSHEIRTPLNGVNALSEVLSRTTLTARQKEMVDTIHNSGVVLNRLLSDILDLARVDAGAMSIEQAPFKLGEAVRMAVRLMTPRAQERGLELRLDLDPAVETAVVGDATRLRQILNNLLSNAIKFTDQGHVSLTVRREAGVVWRFEVRDTGIGFAAAQKDRIFERFGQADGSATRRFGGTGLGLSISRELANKMGGRLDGDGVPGGGAVFTLLAPLPPAPAEPLKAADTPAPLPEPAEMHDAPAAPIRVLISEDHPANRMVLEVLLAEIGAEFRSTADGQQACEAFEAETFDVILMDMQMPVMDGLSAIRQIRRREQERGMRRTPIILVTANALPEHRSAGMAAGADGFVTKPISPQTLLSAIVDLDIAA